MNVRLSPKHGLNPAIPRCFFCNEKKNEILLFGRLPNDAEAPKTVVFNRVPCKQCEEHMRQGIMFISVRDGDTSGDDAYRTGKVCVLKDEAVREFMQPPELLQRVLKMRCCFIEDSTWTNLGFPTKEQDHAT